MVISKSAVLKRIRKRHKEEFTILKAHINSVLDTEPEMREVWRIPLPFAPCKHVRQKLGKAYKERALWNVRISLPDNTDDPFIELS